ncbi:MAG: hypothetical protein H7145_15680 [Akkermansiaceae bacterium]|nr:hypothetical protein [Armatimonadota bacterium]
MPQTRQQVILVDGATRLPFAATLISGAGVAQMQAVDAQWLLYLSQAVTDALARGVPRYDLPEHKHWERERKARAMTAGSTAFTIEANGEAQAVMIVRTDKTCRLSVHFREPMVYVDYLATAPWNLAGFVPTSRYSQCGISMINAAIRHSVAIGCKGRIGLHSLQDAEGFTGINCLCTIWALTTPVKTCAILR